MPKLKCFTIVAVYAGNHQRYATNSDADTPTDAVINAIQQCRDDNGDSMLKLRVFAVFRGYHSCKDIYSTDARVRPDPVRCRAKSKHRFTVVQAGRVHHVRARNAVEAEFGYIGEVAGVFSNHLDDLSHEVDWARVDASTKVKMAE